METHECVADRRLCTARFEALLPKEPGRLIIGVFLVLLGCGSTSDQETPVTPGLTTAAARASARSAMPRCGPPETPALTSYLDAREGDGIPRHIEVIRDSRNGLWMPAGNIAMPMHHATAIRWTNLGDLPILEAATGDRMRFAFVLLTRDTRQVPGEHQWRTEYTAEVSSVCEVSDDTSRALGVHVPDIQTSTDQCESLEDAVMASAQAAARCVSDAECVVRDAPACDLRGLGCNWMVVRRDADTAPILAAIRAHQGECPASSCDCPIPPTTARCVDEACVAP